MRRETEGREGAAGPLEFVLFFDSFLVLALRLQGLRDKEPPAPQIPFYV